MFEHRFSHAASFSAVPSRQGCPPYRSSPAATSPSRAYPLGHGSAGTALPVACRPLRAAPVDGSPGDALAWRGQNNTHICNERPQEHARESAAIAVRRGIRGNCECRQEKSGQWERRAPEKRPDSSASVPGPKAVGPECEHCRGDRVPSLSIIARSSVCAGTGSGGIRCSGITGTRTEEATIHANPGLLCGREDSNFHGVSPTSTSSLRVYHSATTASW